MLSSEGCKVPHISNAVIVFITSNSLLSVHEVNASWGGHFCSSFRPRSRVLLWKLSQEILCLCI